MYNCTFHIHYGKISCLTQIHYNTTNKTVQGGVPQKNETLFLLIISGTKYRIFIWLFSPENWDPYKNIEYKTISVQYQGDEIFTKRNAVLKQINSCSYCLIVASKPQKLRQQHQHYSSLPSLVKDERKYVI